MSSEPEIPIFSGRVNPTFKPSKSNSFFSRFQKSKSINLTYQPSKSDEYHFTTCTFRCTRGSSFPVRSKTADKQGHIMKTKQFAHLLGVEKSQLTAVVNLLWSREDMVTLKENKGIYVLRTPQGGGEWAEGAEDRMKSTFDD